MSPEHTQFVTSNQERISKTGIKARDIKTNSLLTTDQIKSIPVEHIYQWIRNGLWSKRDLVKYLNNIQS